MVVPLLLLLVIGIAEFGRAYSIQTTLSSAARAGVRVMALQNDPGAARAAAKSTATTLNLTLSDSQISVTPSSCAVTASAPAATATTTISYPFTFLGGGLLSGAITLTGKGVMRCNG